MKSKTKDPKKVAASRKGGKLSPTNFKRNKHGASIAGQRSAWARHSGKLEDFPLGMFDGKGKGIPFKDYEPPKGKS